MSRGSCARLSAGCHSFLMKREKRESERERERSQKYVQFFKAYDIVTKIDAGVYSNHVVSRPLPKYKGKDHMVSRMKPICH